MSVTIETTKDIDACLAIRHDVFVREQGVPEDLERDAHDHTDAIHLIARDGARVLGAARILLKGDSAKIGRVCVAQAARGTGLGAGLIRACLEEACRHDGITRAVLGAQVSAIGFYEGLGFTAFGPVYDDAGIDHRDMDRAL
ncbi:MAG: GNAT family N-acetyltransferase [Rhodobacteraceae bacterium]|nr:GNAT family N-acetyltransferase [Paracoccaceae bacterium]